MIKQVRRFALPAPRLLPVQEEVELSNEEAEPELVISSDSDSNSGDGVHDE